MDNGANEDLSLLQRYQDSLMYHIQVNIISAASKLTSYCVIKVTIAKSLLRYDNNVAMFIRYRYENKIPPKLARNYQVSKTKVSFRVKRKRNETRNETKYKEI